MKFFKYFIKSVERMDCVWSCVHCLIVKQLKIEFVIKYMPMCVSNGRGLYLEDASLASWNNCLRIHISWGDNIKHDVMASTHLLTITGAMAKNYTALRRTPLTKWPDMLNGNVFIAITLNKIKQPCWMLCETPWLSFDATAMITNCVHK